MVAADGLEPKTRAALRVIVGGFVLLKAGDPLMSPAVSVWWLMRSVSEVATRRGSMD